MNDNKMTSTEKRAIISLSSIMSLRMIGLFMVLPVFALYARQLHGATPTLIGMAMGIYGLAQAILQIPFGMLSDRYGRKPVIFFGLIIFMAGSIIAGMAHSIIGMIIGRSLQGAGAVGSTILALMADLTREEQRTKAMAISGISIGFSFSLAMLIGPLLTRWMPVPDLFLAASGFGLLSLFILWQSVPTPVISTWHRDTEPELKSFLKLLVSPDLAKLNIGILILHAIFTASFIVIPIGLYNFAGLASSRQWEVYLPTLLAAFVITMLIIGMAERKQKVKPYFAGAIFTLGLSEIVLWLAPDSLLFSAIALCLFFAGFSILEAFLPSLISRTAPVARKGSAMGIYSCSQFSGIFLGGVLGGWLYGKFGFSGVYLFCVILSLFWLVLALLMQSPRYLVTRMLKVSPSKQAEWDNIAAKLHIIPGMVEITFIAEDGIAYLKMERATAKTPDFLHLQEHITGNI